MKTAQRHRLALDASVRSYDVDGRLRVATSHISKACVSPYMGSEIPGWEALGLDPHQVYGLLRAPTELKKAEVSFNNIPILIKHEAVSAADPKKDLVVGATGSNAAFDGESGFLSNSLSIWDDAAIKLIESGAQKELSCGYRYVVDMRPGNGHLVGAPLLALMKPTAILINTSRGQVLDAAALAAAIRGRKIAGAAIDVFDPEPPGADYPLLGLDNVLLTPHVAARTSTAVENMGWVVRDVVDVLNGRPPTHPAP